MKKRWILIGEDDSRDAVLTARALAAFNESHEIVVAEDGAEVLDHLYHRGKYIEVGQGPPAAVLLDIKMPKVDGLEVLRLIKKDARLRRIPIIMLTSSRHDPDVKECYELGANGYIVKPMDYTRYTHALHLFAEFWLNINEPSPE